MRCCARPWRDLMSIWASTSPRASQLVLRALARALLPATMVGACASLPPSPQGAIGHEITGRFSVRYTDLASTKAQALTGSFVWRDDGSSVDVTLIDPFGRAAASIHYSPTGATLQTSNGNHLEGASPDELTRVALGWPLPVAGLGAWLDGHAATPATAKVTVESGTRRIDEDGWSVTYPGFDGHDGLPSHVDLSYPGPGAAVELRLLIDAREGP